jgi:RNA polymerase sigma-70 factor (ECF subfamily)
VSAHDTVLSDLDLAERAAGADVPLQMDEEAFRGFYERTSRPLWRYLYRLTGDRHSADDLLQEAYYRFLRTGPEMSGETHARHYLFRIATNAANDRFRRRQVRPIEVAADAGAVQAAGSTPAHERDIDVRNALARLGTRERSLLLLAYVQGASHEEIAGVFRLRTSSVKTLLFRARRRLARLVGHGSKEA